MLQDLSAEGGRVEICTGQREIRIGRRFSSLDLRVLGNVEVARYLYKKRQCYHPPDLILM